MPLRLPARTLLLLTWTLSACATVSWAPVPAAFAAPEAGFEVALPSGWMRLTHGGDESLMVTRDGTTLQRITVWTDALATTADPHGGKPTVNPDTSPENVAQAVVDELKAVRGWRDVHIVENAPARVSGRPGFRIVATFRDSDGLKTELATYGVIARDKLYRLTYIAPKRYYFALDLPTFEKVVASFRCGPD